MAHRDAREGNWMGNWKMVLVASTLHTTSENDVSSIRLQLKCDGTWWHTRGEVKGKLANGLGSQYPSHYLGTWCIHHYYSWCAHLGCQQSTELTPPPADLNGLVRFARKTKSGFCAYAVIFRTQSIKILNESDVMHSIGRCHYVQALPSAKHIVVSCLVCIVVILRVIVVLCVYCCFYFRCRTAG